MSSKSINGKKIALTALLFVLLFFCGGVKSEAKWIQNKDGTYSWLRNNGKIATSTWINNRKYVDENGIRVTGKYQIDGKYYFFNKSNGALLKSTWIKNGSKYLYAQSNGVLCQSGKFKIGGYYYYFNKNCNKKTGLKTIGNYKYYFQPDKNGRMAVKKWIKIDGKYYRFSTSGRMRKNAWIGDRYVTSTGAAASGWKTISGKKYYFDKSTCKRYKNTTKTISGKTYKFDKNGVATEVASSGLRNSTRSDLHSQYWSDPAVDDETLLASIIYCEAGGESYKGQVAVGLVILNRLRSSSYPNTFAEVIYQNQQFEPARTGSLTNCLKNSTATSSCKKAAAEVMSQYNSGQKAYLDGYGDFSGYYFFMTPSSYNRLGLKATPYKLGGHYFLKSWY